MVYAYDIECLLTIFTVTFESVTTNETRQFVICHTRNNSEELLRFLESGEIVGLVGFNNIGYDSPIMKKLLTMFKTGKSAQEIVLALYHYSQEIISDESRRRRDTLDIPELDLYLLYHFNNQARATSLKWVQCHLKMDNIQDMPIPHDAIIGHTDIELILDYNANDVSTTKRMYNHKKTKELIELRKWAKKNKGLTSINISNSTMGEQIFMRALGDIPEPDTSPRKIRVRNLILPCIKFKGKVFNNVLDKYKELVIKTSTEEKKIKFEVDVTYDGMGYEFGLGGLHAARENTRWREKIHSLDVKSFYPRIAISFGLRPRHLGIKFNIAYLDLYDERVATTNKTINNALKEALNSVFGKSNSIYSLLFDPSFTFSTTINGQLLMAMLAEDITESNAGTIIMINTDGMEVRVYNEEIFRQCIENWKRVTKMLVSENVYRDIMIRDVNNYIAVDVKGELKVKGVYEIEKDWHKDPSMIVCSKAVKDYFLNGTPIKEFITGHKEQSDFDMFVRAKTGKFKLVEWNGFNEQDAPKTLRYVAANAGELLIHETDARRSKVHIDTGIIIKNDLRKITAPININYDWYVREARKLVVEENRLSLF